MVRSSFGLDIFRLREVIKNAGILAYVKGFWGKMTEKMRQR